MRWFVLAVVVTLGTVAAGQYLDGYLLRLAVLTAIYVSLAVGYNLVISEAGQFHLGFVAYFAVGAYAVAIPTTHFGWTFLQAIGVSMLAVVAFSSLLGALLLRFRGDYLSVVSLALAEILRLSAANFSSITGGYQGLPGVPAPVVFGYSLYDQKWYLYLATVLAFLTILVVTSMTNGGAGLAWRSIRQNETAVRSVGLQVGTYKQLSFQIGGFFAGLAGAIYASYQTIVDPSLAAFDGTIVLLTMVILGGGSLLGLLIATAVLVIMPEVTRVFDQYRMLSLGLLFVVLMNWRPNGFGRQPRMLFRGSDVAAPLPLIDRPLVRNGTELLSLNSVSRRFGGLLAVNDVHLSVSEGEILGVIGPNGAGKTTIFNLIAGVIKPTQGSIRFAGLTVDRLSVEKRSMLGIARTFQSIELCPDLTCLENVMLPRLARCPVTAWPFGRRVDRERSVAQALGALSFVDLSRFTDERAGALSYGDRRRLEIARALAAEPRLLLLDEPAAGMNQTEAHALVLLIRKIRDLGVTVVIIEHNVRLVRQVSDRIVVFASGKVIANELPDTVLSSPRVIEAYLGNSNNGAS